MQFAGGSRVCRRFWDAASGQLIWTLRAHRGGITGLHFDGDDLLTRGAAGEISRWSISNAASPQALDRVVRCLPLRFDDEAGLPVEQAPCADP